MTEHLFDVLKSQLYRGDQVSALLSLAEAINMSLEKVFVKGRGPTAFVSRLRGDENLTTTEKTKFTIHKL